VTQKSKPLRFMGTSRDDLCDLDLFPAEVRVAAGQQLRRVQDGKEPKHWKPFKEVGAGTNELIIDLSGGWFRVMYIAKFEEAVYVLHCFKKKTNQTSKKDKQVASDRYQEVIRKRSAS